MTEVLDDKFAADKKKEQDEFDAAFDEIEGKDPEFKEALHGDDKHLNTDDTKGDSLKPDATDTTPEANKADGAVAKKEGDAQMDNTDPGVNTNLFDGLKESSSATEGTDSKDAEISELQAALSKEQQKTSSWDGRIKAANQRADDAESKAKEFEARLKALESGTDATEEPAESGNKAEAIAKFFADFPEFEEPLRALIAQGNTGNTGVTMDEVKAEILPEVEKANAKTEEQVSQAKFMADLREYHDDVVDLINSGAILKWIDLQPAYIAKELTRVYTGGTVAEAKTLVDEFKRTSGYKSTNSEHTDPSKDAKLNSMLEVDSDSAGPPAGEPDKADFDAAADEAFKED